MVFYLFLFYSNRKWVSAVLKHECNMRDKSDNPSYFIGDKLG